MEKYPREHFVGLGLGLGVSIGFLIGLVLGVIAGDLSKSIIFAGFAIPIGLILGFFLEKRYNKLGMMRELTEEEKKRKIKFFWIGFALVLLGMFLLFGIVLFVK
ncbi:MAG: hypothetical protein KJ646_02255 [Nanoarchaeota archaeon]|nr:hypothetical protein [Nanoarchaeota archaeon]MBU4116421.1 hypothetical protein [Nanoarchaeota archaeon]